MYWELGSVTSKNILFGLCRLVDAQHTRWQAAFSLPAVPARRAVVIWVPSPWGDFVLSKSNPGALPWCHRAQGLWLEASHIVVGTPELPFSRHRSPHLWRRKSLFSYAPSLRASVLAPSFGKPLGSMVKPSKGLLAWVAIEINIRSNLSMPDGGSFTFLKLLCWKYC